MQQARAQREQTRQFAALDTRVALNELAEAQATWEASRGTAEQAQRTYAIDEVRYREGISTQTDLTQSRLLLEQARANRAQAASNLAVARVRLALLHDLPLQSSGRPARPRRRARRPSSNYNSSSNHNNKRIRQIRRARQPARVDQQGAFSHEPGKKSAARTRIDHFAPCVSSLALDTVVGCKGADDAKAATTPTAMIVGPENIAVVKARADPLRSGDLRHAPAGAAGERCAPKSAARSCRRSVEQGSASARARCSRASTMPTLREVGALGARGGDDGAEHRRSRQASGRAQRGAAQGRRDRRARPRDVAATSTRRRKRSWRTRRRSSPTRAKQLSKATIAAPFSGIVSARQVSAGDVVQPGARAVHDRESDDDAARGVGAGGSACGGAHRRAGGLHGERLSDATRSPDASRASIRWPTRRRARCASSCRCRTRTACSSVDCSPTATWRARCAMRRSLPIAAVDERGLRRS